MEFEQFLLFILTSFFLSFFFGGGWWGGVGLCGVMQLQHRACIY